MQCVGCQRSKDVLPVVWQGDAHVGMARASDLLQRVLGHGQVGPAVGPARVRDARVEDKDRNEAAVVLSSIRKGALISVSRQLGRDKPSTSAAAHHQS